MAECRSRLYTSHAGPSRSSRAVACSGLRYPDRAGREPVRPGSFCPTGMAPVEHECLAISAQHDVARLDIQVNDMPVVRIVQHVADVTKPPEELSEIAGCPRGITRLRRFGFGIPGRRITKVVGLAPAFEDRFQTFPSMESSDNRLEGHAPDQTHGETGVPLRVEAEPMDGHDPAVFERAR